ncbi:class I SAM-dependent methyltransferase [Mycobacterium sp. 1274761.0]|uniref:class I SAM-dependent methyltransferase n=1 Tax=Mycobacterium sp. 1274761.0 TaxID=1834077 RepID=UPI0007FCA9A2|nr:class I SAM-dependent methyltransferase [Mycobacterium sp. 1274761.0]OBK74977.1 methyltransferase type 12 [Mycobacterium sp. 1274761.0]
MGGRRLLFTSLYRFGFTPWDGHPIATSLRDLVEGDAALPAGTALDVGCGTGDNSIYLAKHGWRVTGVDYVAKALNRARTKAADAGVDIRFRQADVTDLSSADIGATFALVIDSGCLHGMSDDDRSAYAREVTAVAAPDARLHIVAFTPGALYGVPGIEPDEVERRFDAGWTLVSSGSESAMGRNGADTVRYYLFQRAS